MTEEPENVSIVPEMSQLKRGILLCLASRGPSVRKGELFCETGHFNTSEIFTRLKASTIHSSMLDRNISVGARIPNPFQCTDRKAIQEAIYELFNEGLVEYYTKHHKRTNAMITKEGALAIDEAQNLKLSFEEVGSVLTAVLRNAAIEKEILSRLRSAQEQSKGK
jgi:hypothetical protein